MAVAAPIALHRHGASGGREDIAVDAIDLRPLAKFGKSYSQGRFGEAIARHEGLGGKADAGEGTGEFLQDIRTHHLAADTGDPPGLEVQGLRRAIQATAVAEVIAEGRAEGDGAAGVGQHLQPNQGPARKTRRCDVVDAHLGHHRGQAKAHQSHVVIKRQPGDAAVPGAHFETVTGDAPRVAGDRALGDENTARR